jgi:hypothetical protein
LEFQEASALIVTQHYDTLQVGADTNSNLIYCQISKRHANNMIASFSASNQVGELMKKRGEKELRREKHRTT